MLRPFFLPTLQIMGGKTAFMPGRLILLLLAPTDSNRARTPSLFSVVVCMLFLSLHYTYCPFAVSAIRFGHLSWLASPVWVFNLEEEGSRRVQQEGLAKTMSAATPCWQCISAALRSSSRHRRYLDHVARRRDYSSSDSSSTGFSEQTFEVLWPF